VNDANVTEKENVDVEPEVVSQTEENTKNIDISDDVVNLKVPEIIWMKTATQFQNKIDSDLQKRINLKFLSALLKYGNKTNYKILKDKIIKKIREDTSNHNSQDIDAEVKIVSAKLEKYDQKNLLKKSIGKFTKLAEKNKDNINYILSQMITLLEKKNENCSSEDKEKIYDYILTNVSTIIDYTKLIEDISNTNQNDSLTILKFLYENLTYTGNKYKSLHDLNKLIEKSIEKSFNNIKSCDVFLSEITQIYCKYMIYKKNEEAETIFTNMSCKLIQAGKIK